MAHKKNIIVCLNSETQAALPCRLNDFDIKVFTSFDGFKKLNDKDLRAIEGFVVLCELNWSHQLRGSEGSLWKGISLAQGYLRSQKNLTAPIVFVSYSFPEEITQNEPNASIIMTPALQHQFVQLLPNSNFKTDVLDIFKGMRSMTPLELRYTQQLYCDFKGMLHRIKHNIGGSDNDTLKAQIAYVIDKRFPNERERLDEKLNASGTDLRVFCQELLDMMDDGRQVGNNTINPEFVCNSGSSPIKTLLLEDNLNDKHVNRFIEYIRNKNKVYQEQNKVFLFEEPRVVRDEKDFDSKFKRIKFEVIICDIEIKDEKGRLNTLGFNVIEKLVNKGYTRPLYYIVTNVTRSFYDQIKIPRVNRIRLKAEVFGSDTEIERLLYGIKEVVQHKEQEMDDPNKYLKVFRTLDNYVRNSRNYPIDFKNKTKFGVDRFDGYDELESCVRMNSLELIKQFLLIMNTKSAECGNGFKPKKEFDAVCNDMRGFIRKGITCGNEKFVRDFDFEAGIKPSDVEKFVIRLILRRYFLYLTEFVKHLDLKDYLQFKENMDFSVIDIACRGINTQYKGENNDQSKCLNYTVLYSSEIKDELQQTPEEKAFVKAVKDKGEEAFNYDDEDFIEELDFSY